MRTHLRIVVFAPLAPQFWGEPYLRKHLRMQGRTKTGINTDAVKY
jgi:hypothetical protein